MNDNINIDSTIADSMNDNIKMDSTRADSMKDNIYMDSTIADSMNDNINMDSTMADSMNDNINMDSTIADSMNDVPAVAIVAEIACMLSIVLMNLIIRDDVRNVSNFICLKSEIYIIITSMV